MLKPEVSFDGAHCSIQIRRPAPRVVVVHFAGKDTGELGNAPFLELEKDLDAADGLELFVELFIDAREGLTATMDVSSEWAMWLAKKKPRLQQVSMLTGTRFIQLSAEFVKKFAQLGETMRLYTDPAHFEAALSSSVASSRGG